PLTRRDALRQLTAASAGLALGDAMIRGQSSDITVAGKRVEIVVSSISESTVRITALPVDAGLIQADDSLVEAAAGKIVARRALATTQTIRAGHLSISVTSTPPTIHVETVAG